MNKYNNNNNNNNNNNKDVHDVDDDASTILNGLRNVYMAVP
jgi:hypothetical protein